MQDTRITLTRWLRCAALAVSLAATASWGESPAATATSDVPARDRDTPSRAATATNTTPSFDEVDKNHDGYVDSFEAGAIPGLIGTFDTADRDRDGRLDRGEFEAATRQLKQKR